MTGSERGVIAMDVETIGTGETCLVAVHGIQGTRAAWLPVARELAAECQVVLPNLRGRARATRGRGVADYTLAAYADDLQRVISIAVEGRPFFLAGWSMGVSVALEYLRRADAVRPQGLILLSGSPCLCETRWFTESGDGLLAEIAQREERLGLREAADRDAVAWTWQAIGGTDQRPGLRDVSVPTLVLHGSADEDSPWPHAVRLRDGIAEARLVTFDGGRHGLLTQNTAAVATHIRRFIAATATTEGRALES